MSVRLFKKTITTMVCLSAEGGICVFEDEKTGEKTVLYPGNKLIVEHDINVSGPNFLVDKRAMKAFVAGLQSVGFTEKATQ